MTVIAIPALIAYASWVMPEWLVVASALAALWVAVRWGMRPSGAALCGLVLGACVLIRESGIFLIPALVLLIGASLLRLSLFAGSFLALCILVWAYRAVQDLTLRGPTVDSSSGMVSPRALGASLAHAFF